MLRARRNDRCVASWTQLGRPTIFAVINAAALSLCTNFAPSAAFIAFNWDNPVRSQISNEDSTVLRAYSLPPNAKLFDLEMSDVDFGHFIHGRPKYTANVANDVDVTTVTWETAFTGGSSAVAVKAVADTTTVTTDADNMTDGYQVDLAAGTNVITITVTAPNGTDTYAYTVTRASG